MHRRPAPSRERFRTTLERLKSGQPTGSSAAESADAKRRRHRSVWELVRGFLVLIRGQRRAVAFALATVTLSTLLGLIPPAVTKLIVDHVVGTEPWPATWPLGGDTPPSRKQLLFVLLCGTLIVAFLKNTIHLWGRWVATRASKWVQLEVRRQAFDHAVRLPLHRVHELKSGGVASLLREDAGTVGELIFGLMYNPWRAVVQLLGSLAVLAFVDWQLLVGGLVLLPLVYFSHRTWISQIRPQFRAVRNTRQDVDAQTTETFGGMRVVRAFGRQRSEAGRFVRSNNLLIRQELRAWWSMRLVEVLWSLLIPFGMASLLWYGGGQVLEGRLSLGDLMMFLVYLLMLLEPLAVLAESAATLQNSLAALDRVFDLLAEPREFADLPGNQVVRNESVRGEIHLDQVTFSYPGSDRHVIEQVSLTVPAGTTVALVGPSGAGKTTLCNLVARFYDPLQGRVMLDGVDIRDYNVESYRRLLGVVEQDVFLFDGTVAENIAFGRPTATDADVLAAAQVANAAEFINELPNGYDTVIGERGVKLSGGQRQRLAIARAVLADPKILVLDEATSNLDSESEHLIQQGLVRLMEGRTCFVIAHRLSTIRHADQIVVVQEGRIVETGTHDELLMRRNGRYRWMVELQTGGPAVEK